MALNLKDRVKETCAAPGTGTVTLLGPVNGYAAFSTVGTGNTTYYAIVDNTTFQWEVGTGTWTTGGSYGTLARTTVLSNSLGTTALINFSTGVQDVYITLPSQFAVTNVSVATANGFSGNTTMTNSVPSITLKTTANGLLYGNSTTGVVSNTIIGQALNLTMGVGFSNLSVMSATRSTVGVVYGSTPDVGDNTALGGYHSISANVTNSTVIGASAYITYSTSSPYTSRGGISIGRGAGATSANTVVIGGASTANGADSIAIGSNVTTTTNSIVLGSQSKSNGTTGSILIGNNISASNGLNVTIIGNNVSIDNTGYSKDGAVVIGANTVLTPGAVGAVVIGDGAYTDSTASSSAYGAIAIGSSAGVMGDNATAIGTGAQAQAEGTAVGTGANASVSAVTLGEYGAAGNNSLALGSFANATTPNSIVLTAQGSPGLTAPNTGVFIDTIRDESAGSPDKTLKYNTTTKEIFYGVGGGGGSGTVTNVSVVTANGLGGTVATSTTTPAITLSSSVNGIVRGNGTALSAATIGTGLNFTGGTLNATAATASALGVMYGLTGTDTTNINNTGLGYNHVISGSVNSTAIGNNANITAVGSSSFTTQGGVAVGRLAKTTSVNGVAIGANSSSRAGDSVVIGANATLAEQRSVVIGSQARSTNATSPSEYSIAIGYNANVSSAGNAVVLGGCGSVAADAGVAIGSQATVGLGANSSVAIGDAAYAISEGVISIGPAAGTSNGSYIATNAISIGASSQSIGEGATSIGVGTVAGNFSTAIGAYANATTPNSIVLSAQSTYPGLSSPNSGVFIDTIRDESAGSPNKTLKYNTTTKEIFYGTGGGGSGTVTNVSVVTANGLGGTVATSTTTPAITLSTSVTGVLKGNGTAISAATAGTDYLAPPSGTSILKGNSGGALANAVAGTDYAPATSGSSILYGNGTGGFSSVTVGSGLSFTAGTLAATGGGGSGTVTDVSVVTANGFGGTVATSTSTPAITITTGVTGILKGNGTAIAAATAGTDYSPATSGTAGQLLTNNGTGGFTNIASGTAGYFLTSTGSAPQWTQTLGAANGGTGLNALGTGVATFLGTPSSANLAAAVTDETGSGALVFATSPTLVTPVLGTPTSGNLTNATGYPTANLTGLGTGVATALSTSVGSAGAFVTLNGSLGTPSSGTLSGCTVDGTNAVGFRTVPINSQAGDYTTVLADSGKLVYRPSGDTTARTYTINGTVAYDTGTVITFVNFGATANVSIAITTDTLYLTGTIGASTGTRTLARFGMATAVKVASGVWMISGNGLS
jgi:hypothetical protein